MTGLSPVLANFDLGEYVGVGLNTNQIGYLAGALFLGLFGLSALRHARRATGAGPVVWVAVAIGLFAGTLLLVGRGFPNESPDWLRPWTETDRLTRAAAVAILLGCSAILLSAHRARGTIGRLACRLAGLGVAGLAVWLAAGWFADQIPAEVQEWTVQAVIVRAVIVLALVFLAAAFWVRESWGSPHGQWLSRALTPAVIAIVVILGARWFGTRAWPDLPVSEIQFVAIVLAAIGTGTCLLISAGAYLIRKRPEPTRMSAVPIPPTPLAVTGRPVASARSLPVAVLLDDLGRPVLPSAPGKNHSGSSGA